MPTKEYFPSTFYYWLKKSKLKEAQPKMFIPLSIEGEQLPAHKKYNHLRHQPGTNDIEAPVFLELVFPNGTVLKVRNQVDLPLLQKLGPVFSRNYCPLAQELVSIFKRFCNSQNYPDSF